MTQDRSDRRWKTVIDWFGYKPNFHDAEVLSIELQRAPKPSIVRVHAWHTLDEIDDKGFFRQDRHAVVNFILRDIIREELRSWNHQNVISLLRVRDEHEGPTLTIEGIYGVEGEIVAKEISIEIEPLPRA